NATLHILLALRTGEKHGYAIMGEVEQLSEGRVRLGPGTLYGAVKRMLADGFIEESDERPDPALDDERRRYYRVTALGERGCAALVAGVELDSEGPGRIGLVRTIGGQHAIQLRRRTRGRHARHGRLRRCRQGPERRGPEHARLQRRADGDRDRRRRGPAPAS